MNPPGSVRRGAPEFCVDISKMPLAGRRKNTGQLKLIKKMQEKYRTLS